MAIVNRFNIKVIAGAGLFAAAIALSPDAAADPLMTGGYACIQGMAGDAPVAAGDPVAAGGPAAAGACSAALTDMAGVPFVAPGPVPAAAPVPIGAPVPIPGAPVPIPGGPVPIPGAPVPVPAVPAPVIPVGTPLIALGPVLAGAPGDGVVSAPIIGMSGVKDALTDPAPAGGPVPGQPVLPGPSASAPAGAR
ncbi:Probable conserved proline, glycine, valine-rich secreted protein [Mycobacterium tuberculosis]|nr:Probable conserved proline, glycine, valine-rich secreted protein [Mycobacterium tuberculosis]